MQDSYVREFGKTTCTDFLARSKLTMVLYHIAAQVANLCIANSCCGWDVCN